MPVRTDKNVFIAPCGFSLYLPVLKILIDKQFEIVDVASSTGIVQIVTIAGR